jgi:hypothetical protein
MAHTSKSPGPNPWAHAQPKIQSEPGDPKGPEVRPITEDEKAPLVKAVITQMLANDLKSIVDTILDKGLQSITLVGISETGELVTIRRPGEAPHSYAMLGGLMSAIAMIQNNEINSSPSRLDGQSNAEEPR